MSTFMANNLISGKLSWEKVEKSPTYAKYADAALVVLDQRGYMIDENGNCVPKIPE